MGRFAGLQPFVRSAKRLHSGLTMHWAQYCGMHTIEQELQIQSIDEPHEIKLHAWKRWVARAIDWDMVHSDMLNHSGNDQRIYNTANFLKGNFCELKDGFKVHILVYDLLFTSHITSKSFPATWRNARDGESLWGGLFARCE